MFCDILYITLYTALCSATNTQEMHLSPPCSLYALSKTDYSSCTTQRLFGQASTKGSYLQLFYSSYPFITPKDIYLFGFEVGSRCGVHIGNKVTSPSHQYGTWLPLIGSLLTDCSSVVFLLGGTFITTTALCRLSHHQRALSKDIHTHINTYI